MCERSALRSFRGTPYKLKSARIGRVATGKVSVLSRGKTILVKESPTSSDFGYAAILGSGYAAGAFSPPSISDLSPNELEILRDGDVILVEPDGSIKVLWETSLPTNAFLLTTACNCKCLMCPQPPEPHSSHHMEIAYAVLHLIDSGYSGEVCLTGGEPTLLREHFLQFLAKCSQKVPKASIVLLTNGKQYADFGFAKEVAQIGLNRLMHCVSLHADVDELHDRIVGSSGSFVKTQRGLHNLARLRQRIEIRCVVSRLNADRLPQIAWHIYRNYPFVDHVTFMALEMTGLAIHNQVDVWIDPFDYQEGLEEAVRCLHRAHMRVSVYNHPLCLVSSWTRSFARQSISAWKNVYLTRCERCPAQVSCCGFFSTSEGRLSKHIQPLEADGLGDPQKSMLTSNS